MPRVALQKLKQQHNDGLHPNQNFVDNSINVDNHNDVDELIDKSTSVQTTFKRKIFDACWGKQNVAGIPDRHLEKNIEENTEFIKNRETQMEDRLLAATGPSDIEDRNADVQMKPTVFPGEHITKSKRIIQNTKEPVNINADAIEAMKKAELMVQKGNRGRKLRVVVVESESEEENGRNQGNNDWDLAETSEFAETRQEQLGSFVVCADVHQEDSMQFQEERNGERRERADNEGKRKHFEAGKFNGARPKIKFGFFTDDKVQEVREKISRKETKIKVMENKHIKKPQRKMWQIENPDNQDEVNWGSEESSESDGDWDCDDIPLLPR